MPDNSPNCWLVIANSLFMVKAAKPMLILSTKLMTNRTKTNGMMCVRSLRIVVASIVLGARAVVALTPHPRDGSAQCSIGANRKDRNSGYSIDAEKARVEVWV